MCVLLDIIVESAQGLQIARLPRIFLQLLNLYKIMSLNRTRCPVPKQL